MSESAQTALLVVLALWLLGVTVLLTALARHVGVLQSQNAMDASSSEIIRLDDDGPAVPGAVDHAQTESLTALGLRGGDRVLVTLFSGGCAPCQDRADELVVIDWTEPGLESVALVPGPSDKLGMPQLKATLGRAGFRVVVDPAAKQLADAFSLHSVPFALLIDDGQVIAKTYLRRGSDIVTLLGSSPGALAHEEPARQYQGVSES